MKRIFRNGLEVLQFENPGFEGCVHGFFTRKGGVSTGQWSSLNQGSTVGDERDKVMENKKRALSFFDRRIESLFEVWQVHGTTTICTDKPRNIEEPHIKADAIITNKAGVTLFMRFADCVPILLYAHERKVVGIVHAGWKGTVNNIIGEAIKTIQSKYGVRPEEITAGIGPSIGPDHYIVGEEVRASASVTFGKDLEQVIQIREGKIYFDLWQANQYLIEKQGVKTIETARICTACHLEDWYSHRAENGSTGRFGALIALGEDHG